MFFRLRKRLKHRRFTLQARKIFDTPPIARREAPLAILTMVRHDDLAMYLVAIKSLYRRIGRGGIIVIDDGSLTRSDRRTLEHHLDGPEFRAIADVNTGACPDYVSWRRLYHVVQEAQERYIVQMDSDTVTMGEVPEVVGCLEANRAFILGSFDGQAVWTPEETAANIRERESDHVQIRAERSLIDFPDAARLRYIRGSAGFAGFPRGAISWSEVEAFSRQMESLIGRAKWREWGSEQSTTNYLIANMPDPCVLRMPKYTNHRHDIDISRASFIHFIGSWRFYRGRYARAARQAIRDVSAP